MDKGKGKSLMLNQKRLVIAFTIFCVLLFILCIRVGYVQVVKGTEYSKMAVQQQMKDEILKPVRGKILDRNGGELAVNMEAFSVWVRPAEMKTGKTESARETAFNKNIEVLAQILNQKESDLSKTIKESKRTLLKVSKFVKKKEADEIRKKTAEGKLTGVSLSEEVKRYYPMGDFLAHTLGSVTDDDQGLSGIELKYNNYLAGSEGRWVQNTDVSGNALATGTEKYYKPKDGENVVLTIDQVIQNYTEKSVKNALKKYKAKRVSAVVMETKTGEILSMASAPSFDPNNAKTPEDKAELAKFNKLSTDKKMDYLYEMWRNPLVSDVYEPGSTAKLVTTAACLEEGITSKSDTFNCNGYYTVNGIKVKCWYYPKTHGHETLYEAVGNSCNPVFMQLALKLGKAKYYDYLDLFGLSEKTGIDFPGEANPIIAKEKTASALDLAIMGFGQTNAVTPLQLVTAVSAMGNDGELMQPHLVKKLTDEDGKTVDTFEPKVVRKAISSETAKEMCKIMEYVVENASGTGKKAQIPGYKVGGKTGTSQVAKKGGGYTDDVVASFIGMVPISDPEFTILYIIDSPAGGDHGGEIAAPESGALLEKILKYRDIKPNYTKKQQKEIQKADVVVPTVKGKKISEAKKILKEEGLQYKISPETTDNKEFIVKDQYPNPGAKTTKKGIVYLYRE